MSQKQPHEGRRDARQASGDWGSRRRDGDRDRVQLAKRSGAAADETALAAEPSAPTPAATTEATDRYAGSIAGQSLWRVRRRPPLARSCR